MNLKTKDMKKFYYYFYNVLNNRGINLHESKKNVLII